MPKSAAFARIKAEVIAVTCAVPEGRVTTYAAVGEHLDVMARHVAYILATLTGEERLDVPWHRVVAEGGVLGPASRRTPRGEEQAARLATEGLTFDAAGRLERFADVFWAPEG